MTLGDFYLRLRSIGDPSVDLAMAAALLTADTLPARLFTLSLLERGRIEALVALVLHYHRLGADLQEMVARRNGDLDHPLHEAAMRQNSHGPANIIRIIGQARSLRLTYLVTEQFRHGPEPIRREAARCLLELAESVATCGRPMQRPPYDGRGVEMLQLAIEQLVCVYQHHPEPIVLRAMLALAPRRIARQKALPTPLTLLLSSATFEHHLQRFIDTLTSFERERVKQTMTALKHGLFGQTRPPLETRSR